MEGVGWWLSGVVMSPLTWSLKLLREATRSTQVLLSHAMMLAGGGPGWGEGHVGLAVADAARTGHPIRLRLSDKVPPLVGGGHSDAVSWGGRAFAVGAGERGPLLSADVEQGVAEEDSDALALGGRLDKGGRSNGLCGASVAVAQHLLVSVTPEALLYRGAVEEGKAGGRCGRCSDWWCGRLRGRWCWRGGVVAALCGVW